MTRTSTPYRKVVVVGYIELLNCLASKSTPHPIPKNLAFADSHVAEICKASDGEF
ncbi:hypothetical protein [Dulcicalothrix desertica]|uniref:hypothetical protein n=1 Tax=Dulcicalothrix desertica TaxID=32056 RepID=UPI00131592C3|nr:hypothetical protein [Dulcicalothrix desertica]